MCGSQGEGSSGEGEQSVVNPRSMELSGSSWKSLVMEKSGVTLTPTVLCHWSISTQTREALLTSGPVIKQDEAVSHCEDPSRWMYGGDLRLGSRPIFGMTLEWCRDN